MNADRLTIHYDPKLFTHNSATRAAPEDPDGWVPFTGTPLSHLYLQSHEVKELDIIDGVAALYVARQPADPGYRHVAYHLVEARFPPPGSDTGGRIRALAAILDAGPHYKRAIRALTTLANDFIGLDGIEHAWQHAGARAAEQRAEREERVDAVLGIVRAQRDKCDALAATVHDALTRDTVTRDLGLKPILRPAGLFRYADADGVLYDVTVEVTVRRTPRQPHHAERP